MIEAYLQQFAAIDGRTLTPQVIQAYYIALKRFEFRKLEKGLRRYLEQGERWPWPGTLAEYIENEV